MLGYGADGPAASRPHCTPTRQEIMGAMFARKCSDSLYQPAMIGCFRILSKSNTESHRPSLKSR